MPFTIQFSYPAHSHLKALRKRDQQIIVDAVAASLKHEPDKAARNRKRLEENELAAWELRVGDFRVFYDLEPEDQQVVILAIGKKDRNILRIGDEEVEL